MTISTTTSFDTYIGTDAEAAANEFPITWDRVDTTNDADVRVILVDESVSPATEEVLTGGGTDYTVDSSDNVVLEAARIAAFTTANDRLVILRNQTDIQPTHLLNNASFQAETLETSLDRITALVQQNSRDLDRTLKTTETAPYTTTAFDPTLPAPEASQLIRIKSDNSGFELVSAQDIVSVAGTDHSTLSNLTSGDDHTQYALLAGRSGGQTLHGGSAAGNNLILESTDDTSEGQIIIRDTTALVLEPSGVTDNTPLVLRFREDTANGSNYIGLQAPSAIGTSVTFTLPDADGTNGQVLQTNGTGTLSWVSTSPSDHGSLTGLLDDDHTQYLLLDGRTGGQEIFGGIDDGSALVLKATNSAVQGSVEVRESLSLSLFSHGLLGADVTELRLYTAGNPATNYVGFEAPGTLAGDQIWVLPATDGAANQVLVTDGAGTLSFAPVTSSTPDINGQTAAVIATGDEIIFADADDSFNPKKTTIDLLLDNAFVNDQSAIHDDVAGEIAAVTLKATPVGADVLLIEDSADSNNKKRIAISSLPTSSIDINALAAATPVTADEFVFADADDSFNNKKVTLANLVTAISGEGVTDADAIHDNVAGEIAAVTEKVTPVNGDFLLIEDSADSNNKKRIQIGNLPASGAGEVNTASNQGAGGVGFFDAKNGVDLEFRNLNVGSKGGLTVALDAGNKEVDIDLAIDGLTPTAIAAADELVFSDADDSNNNKAITFANFESSLNLANIGGTLAFSNVSGTVPINQGGTGQTTQTAAFDALSPTTTKGDVIVDDGTNAIRLAVGTDGQVLTANSATASGLEWAAAAGGGGSISTIDARTSDFTIATVDGTTAYTNDGAAGEVIATVPAASAGDSWWATVTDAQNFRFESTGGDTFVFPDSGLSGITQFESSTVGSTVYAVAVDANTWHMFVDEGTWAQAFDLPRMFAPGGLNTGSSIAAVHEGYDFNTWSVVPSPSTGGTFDESHEHSIANFTAAVVYNKIWGNAASAGNNANLNQEFDKSGNAWTNRGATPLGQSESGGEAIGTTAYFVGSVAPTTTTRTWDSVGDTFGTTGAYPVSISSMHSNMTQDGTDAFTMGGSQSGVGPTNPIRKYSVAGGTWGSEPQNLLATRSLNLTMRSGTIIYSLGGQPANTVYRYDTVAQSAVTNPANLNNSVSNAGGGEIGTLLYINGGTPTGASNAITANDELDTTGDTIASRAAKTTAVISHVGAAV